MEKTLFLVLILLVWSTNGQNILQPWVTTGDQAQLLQQGNDITSSGSNGQRVIEVFKDNSDQTMKGFGAAISNGAAQVLYRASDKANILKELFHPTDGIGISYIRLVMGGSDFNGVEPYTYDDVPPGQTDWDLERFSIQKDREFVIPLLKEILAINPAVRIVASPWSAPAWMKTPESLNGGQIKNDDYLPTYANYFVRFIQDYSQEGITIDAVTLQNEPEHSDNGYPTMTMSWQTQSTFIRESVGPAFRQNNINTEIWIWDHNWDNTGFSIDILNDQNTRQFVQGSGWHCYAGDKNAPRAVRLAHPDKDLFFTECSGGEWDSNFSSSLRWQTQNLFIAQARLGSRVTLLWNMALDDNHGPRVGVTGGCSNCRGVLTVNSSGQWSKSVEYYVIGHFSKFVKPNSVKIDSTSFEDDLESVAFIDDEGKETIVVVNAASSGGKSFQIKIGNSFYSYNDLPASAVVTFKRP